MSRKLRRNILEEAVLDARAIEKRAADNAIKLLTKSFTPKLDEIFNSELNRVLEGDSRDSGSSTNTRDAGSEEDMVNKMRGEAEEADDDEEVTEADTGDDASFTIDADIDDVTTEADDEYEDDEEEMTEADTGDDASYTKDADIDDVTTEGEEEDDEFPSDDEEVIEVDDEDLTDDPTVDLSVDDEDDVFEGDEEEDSDEIDIPDDFLSTEAEGEEDLEDEEDLEEGAVYVREQGKFRKIEPADALNARVAKLESEKAMYSKALGILQGKLSEVNLFNSKIAHMYKLSSSGKLSGKQISELAKKFDSCKNVPQVKKLYKRVVGSINENKSVNLNFGFGNRKAIFKKKTDVKNIYESAEVRRMRELAGIKTK